MKTFQWSAVGQFIGREDDLARMQQWWDDPRALPLNLYGRRRVGKSWLFRRFAHDKPAVILVAEQNTPAQQFTHLVDQLEPHLSLRPDIKDISALFAALFKLGEDQKVLVVLDEFPYLLGTSSTAIKRSLSAVQAAIERYRDESKVKLIVCGSAVTQMEELQAEKSPLHGRLQRYSLAPLSFRDARRFMPALEVDDQLTRFSIAGGMPRYLSALSRGALPTAIATQIVDRNAPLFNEPLALLQAELREPAIYLGILEALGSKPADIGALSARTGLESKVLSPYLKRLEDLGMLRRRRPVGADAKDRSTQFECTDAFVRFWFRFVKPHETALEAGTEAAVIVKQHILPDLADHTSIEFERLLQRWVQQNFPEASNVGAWWGNALNSERRAGTRSAEEIDAAGIKGKSIVVAGEAKWTNKDLGFNVLEDLRTYKIPAMAQAGFTPAADLTYVLAARNDFTKAVHEAAAANPNIRLVTAAELLPAVR